MTVAIIDYGSGNLRSAAKAIERAGSARGEAILVTADPDKVAEADRIVLPGVGAFQDCSAGLRALPGMVDAMTHAVFDKGRPFLGICVGMQLLATVGLEHGRHAGLDWIAGDVEPIDDEGGRLKIPHMGWNDIVVERPHPIVDGIATGSHAYFVHSYAFHPTDGETVVARFEYGRPLVAILASGTIVATQFHPEKSQATGLRLLANFLDWRP